MKDLFENWSEMPNNLSSLLESNYSEEATMAEILAIQKECEKIGYTFDYDFGCNAFGLRPVGTAINELEGYEDTETKAF